MKYVHSMACCPRCVQGFWAGSWFCGGVLGVLGVLEPSSEEKQDCCFALIMLLLSVFMEMWDGLL